MRAFGLVGIIVLVLVAVSPTLPQTKDAGGKPAAKGNKNSPGDKATSRALLASLQIETKTQDFGDTVKFGELLGLMREQLQMRHNRDVDFFVDEEAYREETSSDAPNINDVEIRLKTLGPKVTYQNLLRHALQRLPAKFAFVVRSGRVEIVPYARTAKEYMLNQTFHVDFKERNLDSALEELSDLTGVSIILDARAKQKAQTPISARFHDDVALQDAARMLTDMADLKMVYLVTGLYVTTPEHAKEMQKELKELYEPKAPSGAIAVPGGGAPGIGIGPGAPPGGMFGIEQIPSPLAPPLPPAKRREGGAAA
jgi:hypothetical protein